MTGPDEAPPQRPPRLWTVFIAYAALWTCVVFGGAALLIAAAALRGSMKEVLQGGAANELLASPGFLVGAGAISGISGLGLALLGAALSPMRLSLRLRTGPLRASRHGLVFAAAVAGTLGVSQFSDSVIAMAGLGFVGSLPVMSGAISRSTGVEFLLLLLVLGGLAPVAEELFCRGYLQTRFSQRWGMWIAILTTAVLFGLLHADLVHTPFAVVLGIYLGWLTEVTGSVRAAIAGHLANNVFSVSLAKLIPGILPTTTHLVLLVVSAAALVFSVVLVRRHAHPRVH